jgi:hypothetical protein
VLQVGLAVEYDIVHRTGESGHERTHRTDHTGKMQRQRIARLVNAISL